MAFLFYQNRDYGINSNETGLGIITFDLELSEGHNFTNTVTQYNVEDGADISDHIQNNLESGDVSGFITNFSIYDGVIFENKSQLAFDTLRDLWKSKELVDIYTVLRVYEGVAITNISVNRDENSGESLICDFSFQEFNKVKLQEIIAEVQINLKNMKTTQNRQSSPNKNNGKTQGTSKPMPNIEVTGL
jgi:hypothetical protein